MMGTVAEAMVATLKPSGVRWVQGIRVEKAGDLEAALLEAFAHEGPALVDVRTARAELSLPPKLTYGEIMGFTLYATRTILSGDANELFDAKTNLHEIDVE